MNASLRIYRSASRIDAWSPSRPILALAFAWLVLTWPAATPLAAAPIADSDPRFRRIGAEDGLSQASVYAIQQDQRGFVWLGTQDGLHRYDGDHFVVLRPEPFGDDSLSHGLVQAVAEDAAGGLWAGTFRGLDRLRPGTGAFDSFWDGSGNEPAVTVEDIAVATDGSLWIATLDDGLLHVLDPGGTRRREAFRHDPDVADSLPADRVRSVAASGDGAVWIGFDDGSVARLVQDGSAVSFSLLPRHLLPGGAVQALLVDSDGSLWVGARGGLARVVVDGGLESATGSHYRHDAGNPSSLSHNSVSALLQDRDGTIWIGTLGGGLCETRGAGGGFRCHRHDPSSPASLSHDQIRALAQDSGGLIWVGTALGGVTLVDTRPRLGVIRQVPGTVGGLPAKAVRAFAEDASGEIWVGTDGGGVVRLAGRVDSDAPTDSHDLFEAPEVRPQDRALADQLARARTWSLLFDRGGSLWIGGNERLWRYQPGERMLAAWRHDPERPNGIGPGSVRWMLEDEQGLWLALFGGGVDLLPAGVPSLDTDSVVHFRFAENSPESLVSDLALVLHRHASGDLWVGTAEGLSRWWAQREHFVSYRNDPGVRDSLLGDIVRAIHEDSEGNLWIGTDAGLNLLSAELATAPPGAGTNRYGFRYFTEADGLPDHTVYAILPDAEGNLWLSTNRGLARFDPRTETFLAFDLADGLQALEFNGGAQLRGSDGRLYFGGVDGFNAFRPAMVERNGHVPPVVITSVRRLHRTKVDESVWPPDEVVFDHGDRVVTFRFAALDFSDPEENRYSYRLDGLDPQGTWHDLGTENHLTITQLDAGDYVLRVRGSNDDGVWNEAGAALPVRVLPSPWFSWWAWILYWGFGILLLTSGGLQMRRRRDQQRRIHEVVRTSERRLDLALRGSGDGLWDWNVATGEIYRSHVDQLLGADVENAKVDRPFADLEIHPDDLALVERELENHIKGASERFEVEYRLRDPKGGWRWILDRGDIVERDAAGRPMRMAGTFKDMTRQKQVERELRLWQAVFESVSEGVVILDVRGRVRAANPAFCDLTGWRRRDLVGRRSRSLESREHGSDFYRDIRRRLVEGGRWQGEVHQLRRDGSSFLAWVDINAVQDDDGNLTHFVAVCTDITRRKESEEELRRLANYDPLTGLPNRSQFQERLEEALVDARRQGHRVALLFGDLDRFKQINDTLGHSIGDQLLQEAARRLLRAVRERDIVSRLGGDEFTVLLTRIADDTTVVVGVAERIQRTFAPPFELEGHEINVSTSLGIAIFPEDGDSAERLIKHADTAMYEAKTAGRNRYRFWDGKMSRRALMRLNLEGRLRQALDRGELEVHYQPKIDIAGGRIVGFEALARWRRDGELVLPGSFLALAEETGLVLTLGPWVLETALEQLKSWPETDGPALHVSVNVSAPELLREGFAQRVKTVLERRKVEPGRLSLEIHEGALADHLSTLRDVLEELRVLGVRLSLDDFGTGQAALGHLKDLPFHEIKLDPAFVAETATDNGNTVVKAIIAMAHSLGLDVVAEGIETEGLLAALRADGCTLAQGFYLVKPVPAGEVAGLFKSDASWRGRLG